MSEPKTLAEWVVAVQSSFQVFEGPAPSEVMRRFRDSVLEEAAAVIESDQGDAIAYIEMRNGRKLRALVESMEADCKGRMLTGVLALKATQAPKGEVKG